MKGIICYYSSTGNTLLACRYLASKMVTVEFDFFDIRAGIENLPKLAQYSLVGFATFTDWWGIPALFQNFFELLPKRVGQFAFVFNTYANHSGKTLRVLKNAAEQRGFAVLGGHSFRMPGNYPPTIARGLTYSEAPTPREMAHFHQFIKRLDTLMLQVELGEDVRPMKVSIGLFNSLLRTYPRTQSHDLMGSKMVDGALCIGCRKCGEICPYGAIEFRSPGASPLFHEEKCFGCWACFNHCTAKAIYTEKVQGLGHYPGPERELCAKLDIS